MSEYQLVGLDADVHSEVQSVRGSVWVQNEVQTVRTNIDGIDEIQTITTSADEVTPEVQTVTTTANDVDEVQTLTLAATIQDEVQIVRSTVASVPEKQRITYAVKRVDEVQTFGFYLCEPQHEPGRRSLSRVAALKAQLANVPALQKISVKFDIADCGSAEGVNFCQRGVDEDMPSLGLSCDADPANDCVAKEFNLFDSGALIGQDKMEELLSGMTINGVKFIEDAQGPQTPGATGDEGYRSFNVTLTKELINPTTGSLEQMSTGGVFKVEYRVEFTGGHLR